MRVEEALYVLNLKKEDSYDKIKQAYRVLAMRYHPDRPSGDIVRFKEIAEAFESLKDYKYVPPKQDEKPQRQEPRSEKRQYYNTYSGSLNDFFNNKNKPTLDNLDEMPIGEMQNHPKQKSTKNAAGLQIRHVEFDISLQEAFMGCERSIDISNRNSLSGAETTFFIKRGAFDKECIKNFQTPYEHINIYVRIKSPFVVNYDRIIPTSKHLSSTETFSGDIIRDVKIDVLALLLGGSMTLLMLDQTRLNVKIPAGLQTHSLLKIQGQGYWQSSACISRGDLYIRVIPNIKPLEAFSKEDLELLKKALHVNT